MLDFPFIGKGLVDFVLQLHHFLQKIAECSLIGVEERSGEVTAFNPPRQLQSFPELLCLLPLEKLELSVIIYLLDDLDVLVFDAPEIVFLRERPSRVLELVDEGVLYLADIQDEAFLFFSSFFELKGDSLKLNGIAQHVGLIFALFTSSIVTL